jgi:hypothetical protein
MVGESHLSRVGALTKNQEGVELQTTGPLAQLVEQVTLNH